MTRYAVLQPWNGIKQIDKEPFPVISDENKRWILKFAPLNLATCILQLPSLH